MEMFLLKLFYPFWMPFDDTIPFGSYNGEIELRLPKSIVDKCNANKTYENRNHWKLISIVRKKLKDESIYKLKECDNGKKYYIIRHPDRISVLCNLEQMLLHGTGYIFYLPSIHRHDKGIAMKIAKFTEHVFLQVEDFYNDKDVTRIAIKQNGDNFTYASDRLRADKEIGMLAVKAYGGNLRLLPNYRKDDVNFVLAACKSIPFAIRHASVRIKNYPNLLCHASDPTVHRCTFKISHGRLITINPKPTPKCCIDM